MVVARNSVTEIEGETDLPFAGSLPKWLQQPELMSWSVARSQEFPWASYMAPGAQGLELSSAAFPGHYQGAGSEVGQPALKQVHHGLLVSVQDFFF